MIEYILISYVVVFLMIVVNTLFSWTNWADLLFALPVLVFAPLYMPIIIMYWLKRLWIVL